MIAAAHAGCFAMALSGELSRAGHDVTQHDASAAVRVTKGDGGWTIDRIELTVRGQVPRIENAKFVELAETAKANCPVSRALAAVEEITLDAALA